MVVTHRNEKAESVTITYCIASGHGKEGHSHRWRSVTLAPGELFTYDDSADNAVDIAAEIALKSGRQ